MGIKKNNLIPYILIWLTFLGAFIISYFTALYQAPLQLFPSNPDYSIMPYDDQSENGQSEILSINQNDTIISCDFILRKGFVSPYIGLRVHPNDWEDNITNYNTLEVAVSGTGIRHMNLFLITGDDHVKDRENRLADRHSVYGLTISPNKSTTSIKLNDFKTPDWWYSSINQLPEDFKEPDLSQFKGISISTGVNPPLDTRLSIQIYSFRLVKDNSLPVLIMALIQFFLSLVLIIRFIAKSKKKEIKEIQPITIEYKAIPVEEHKEEKNTFMGYIHENYSDPELSLSKISKATGAPQRQITETITENFGCNFKTYINTIRIKEAQRLLKESDLNISEIAYKVGFNSPSSFNRVFKSMVGTSPSEFKGGN